MSVTAEPEVSVVGAAALPMYDLPELRDANDALWSALSARLRDAGVRGAPSRLTRRPDVAGLCEDPRLLLSQTCGLPFIRGQREWVRLVATPGYRAQGCDGPFHRSAVLVRLNEPAQGLYDMQGSRLALNDIHSNTGMNLLRSELAPFARERAFFRQVVLTGSHASSAAAVAEGRADLAAVDCVTWAHLQRLASTLSRRLRVLAWTTRSPGLPLVTGRLTDHATFRVLEDALNAIADDPAMAATRATLLLDRFHKLPERHYRSLLFLEQMAADQGYPDLL